MNKTECENCKRVMEEGIRNANKAIEELEDDGYIAVDISD